MSVRHGLLTLLADGPSYGYQLRARLEEQTGSTWPLNIGQIYTTLTRLQRDGLVEAVGDDGAGHATYQITDAGRDAVAAWFGSPVSRATPARDELAIKLALAVGSPVADVRDVIQVQRAATMRAMQEYARLKAGADPAEDLSWLLVLDSLTFQAEAEIRWLDHSETRLARAAGRRAATEATARHRADQEVDRPRPPGPDWSGGAAVDRPAGDNPGADQPSGDRPAARRADRAAGDRPEVAR